MTAQSPDWTLKNEPVKLDTDVCPPDGPAKEARKIDHIFKSREVHAINTALAAGRPLLVRGEAGVGKSQLARAAAKGLKRRFVSTTIDARTEAQDLKWTFDAVRRLADAQLIGSSGFKFESDTEALEKRFTEAALDSTRKLLDERRYLSPGPLWWGFNWSGAATQAKEARAAFPPGEEDAKDAPSGVVVLLDEIDKAASSVPNGLLESLGSRRFTAPTGERVHCDAIPPLVVVTTNEERSLPDPFLRRCVVLHMHVPDDPARLRAWLTERGRAHFTEDELSNAVLEDAATQLVEDRAAAQQRSLSPPGGAEYLDLLRALFFLRDSDAERQELLQEIYKFTFQKHPRDPDPDE